MLLLVSSIKLVAEVALLALAGQWLLGLLAGQQRDTNLVYQLFKVLTAPAIRLARLLAPAAVLDRHLPLVAGLVLGFVWLAALVAKINLCLQIGMSLCR